MKKYRKKDEYPLFFGVCSNEKRAKVDNEFSFMESLEKMHLENMKKNKKYIDFGFKCGEDLNQMPKTDKGTHCTSCNKDVVDFSLFSSSQALSYLNKNKNVCGSMSTQQLEQLNAYAGLQQARSFSLKAMLTSLTLGASSLAYSQEKNKVLFENENLKVIELASGINPDSLINNKIVGIVTDESGEPMPFVKVILPMANQRMFTDIDGKFSVLYDDAIPGSIHFAEVGYSTDSSLVAHNFANKSVQIVLKKYQKIEITVGIIVDRRTPPVTHLETKARGLIQFSRNRRD
jgi:hypothetical protein